jgi:hypothetical protein
VAARLYYDITALPALGELGSVPPLRTAALLDRIGDGTARELVATVLLREDLLQREAALAGELKAPDPAVLTAEQVRGTAAVPDYLEADTDTGTYAVPGDALWTAYWRHAAAVAAARRSGFLGVWVAAEVGLRNALAAARAAALGLDVARYLVAPELGRSEPAHDAVLRAWAAAPQPLAALQVLLRARWQWLLEHDEYFSFTADELPAYAVRLHLLHRWLRVAPDGGGRAGAREPRTALAARGN